MSRTRAVAVASLAALALTGCGEQWKGEGEIVGRSYDDDDSYSYWVPRTESCSGSGLNAVCTASGGYTAHHHEPERWLLTIEAPDDEGAMKRHTVSVPASIYEACRDGDLLDTETMECTEVPR